MSHAKPQRTRRVKILPAGTEDNPAILHRQHPAHTATLTISIIASTRVRILPTSLSE